MSAKTAISEEEYLRTSFDNPDREYRDGEILERSLPTLKHSRPQSRICSFFEALTSTVPVHPCPELRVKIRPGLYRIPDVSIFYGAEPAEVPETPPLIAIEILSPGDRMPEVIEKMEDYHAWGVPHVWLVDPETQRLYSYEAGLKTVPSLRVPELDLELTPAEIFPS